MNTFLLAALEMPSVPLRRSPLFTSGVPDFSAVLETGDIAARTDAFGARPDVTEQNLV